MRLVVLMCFVSFAYGESENNLSDINQASTQWILNELQGLRQNQQECNAKLAEFEKINSRLATLEAAVSKIPDIEVLLADIQRSVSDQETKREQFSPTTSDDLLKKNTEVFTNESHVPMQESSLQKRQAIRNIAFYAWLSNNLPKIGAVQTIIFDKAITNVGYAYHPNTGTFIAPVRGVYSFHVTGVAFPNTKTYLQLKRDGSNIGYIHPDAISKSSWDAASSSFVLELNQGSQVWVENLYADAELFGGGFSSFSGYLVFEN